MQARTYCTRVTAGSSADRPNPGRSRFSERIHFLSFLISAFSCPTSTSNDSTARHSSDSPLSKSHCAESSCWLVCFLASSKIRFATLLCDVIFTPRHNSICQVNGILHFKGKQMSLFLGVASIRRVLPP